MKNQAIKKVVLKDVLEAAKEKILIIPYETPRKYEEVLNSYLYVK